MRSVVLAVVVAAGFGLAGLTGASAAPAGGGSAVGQAAGHTSHVVPVAMGCGRGWHRNWRGRCVPNRGWRRR